MEMSFHLSTGRLPMLVSMPHSGTDIPDDVSARLTAEGLERADTDWHLPQLYDFLDHVGVSTISARWSRYVIDLNRPPEDTNLYPGLDTTSLCPVDTFARAPLYQAGQAPSRVEIDARIDRYYAPYHAALRGELDRLLALHHRVVLWDAHSIASVVPRFFEGRLPDLNVGTASATSCAPELAARVVELARKGGELTVVENGRFKGGHITRHYGRPHERVHAIQLEMCQCLYMQEHAPFAFEPDVAARVQPRLRTLVEAAATWAAG